MISPFIPFYSSPPPPPPPPPQYKEEDALKNMRNHFSAGITALDTADIYGPSEVMVGKFVASEPRAVPMTKFCCFRRLEQIDRDEVRGRILKQLARLQVKQLPLVAFFWADYSVKRYVEVALMLTELKEEGLIGEIGVTNFDLKRLKELVAAGVPVVSNQVQYSLLDQRPLRSGMVEYCTQSLKGSSNGGRSGDSASSSSSSSSSRAPALRRRAHACSGLAVFAWPTPRPAPPRARGQEREGNVNKS